MRIPVDFLLNLVADVAQASGLRPADAGIFAAALLDADIHGVYTHGIMRLEVYMRRLRLGLIDPLAEPRFTQVRPAALAVDACNGMGHVQAVKTLDRLMDLAREYGTATAAIRNSQHFGTLSYYCNRAAEKDMILFATTNTPPSMAPTGGADAFFGTNPLGVSFPTDKGFVVRIDLATSTVARGKVIAAKRRGGQIPEGWALDREGNPTTDPAAALLGTMLPMAGHKGYALAFLVEALSGVLSGAAVGPELGSMYTDMDRKQDTGHFFMLVDIASLMEPDLFRERMGAMIDAVKAGRRQPGCEEILVPGEMSHRRALENRAQGIPVEDATLRELRELCATLGVPFSL